MCTILGIRKVGYCVHCTILPMNTVGVGGYWKKIFEASPENDQNLFLNLGFVKENILNELFCCS